MSIEQLRQQLRTPGSGRLVIVSAPSGAGKTTLVAGAKAKRPKQLVESISCTTRPVRSDETEGVDYFFKTRDEFERMVRDGQFLEFEEYNGNLYGTPLEPLLGPLRAGQDVILIIEIKGAHDVMARVPEARTFFVLPGGETLEEQLMELAERLSRRAKATKETQKSIDGRLEIAREELAHADLYEHSVVNRPGQAEAAVAEFLRLLDEDSQRSEVAA